MKSLYKKIGAMVLASGLLLGAGAFSSSSVVHADSSFQQLMAKIPDNHRNKKDDIGEIISGSNGMFKVVSIYSSNLSGSEYFEKCLKMDINSDFVKLMRKAKQGGGAKELGLKRECFYELNWDGLKILIRVW